MNRWTSYLSFRYLFTHNGRRGHLGNTLAIMGLSIGIMTLITVLTVMNGFQQSFITSINEVYSYHIRIDNVDNHNDLSSLNGQYGIRSVVAFSDIQGIFTSRESYSSGAQLRLLDMAAAAEDAGFNEKLSLLYGTFPENDNEIILGSGLARYLGVSPGDLISVSRLESGSLSFINTDYLVTGIFSTGYYEYDRNMSFAFLPEDYALLVTRGVKLQNHFKDRKTAAALAVEYPDAEILSWREYNSAFFNALKIEKVFMFLIVALIFIVVAVNIYHSMKRNVKERILELALLKAVGGRASDIRRIYITQGLLIAIISIGAGTSAGVLLSLHVNEVISFFITLRQTLYSLLSRLPFMSLSPPGAFYFTDIPVTFFIKDVLIINLSALVSVLLAAVLSVRKASNVLPAEIFRNE
ncbi:MAG: ABC transporter permease [Spirochaetales bacterium]|nr:ABC transporter permease [Spirochaetales bacterium]